MNELIPLPNNFLRKFDILQMICVYDRRKHFLNEIQFETKNLPLNTKNKSFVRIKERIKQKFQSVAWFDEFVEIVLASEIKGYITAKEVEAYLLFYEIAMNNGLETLLPIHLNETPFQLYVPKKYVTEESIQIAHSI